jgi:RimJ/RimL family protein N-acetyltransferase
MPDNPASRRVLQKLGMRHEGRMRRSHHRHDGFHDMDLFAVLRGEATV